VGVRPPGANGGTGSVFSNLDRLGPARVDRAGPWTVDRSGLDRTGPDRTVFNTLSPPNLPALMQVSCPEYRATHDAYLSFADLPDSSCQLSLTLPQCSSSAITRLLHKVCFVLSSSVLFLPLFYFFFPSYNSVQFSALMLISLLLIGWYILQGVYFHSWIVLPIWSLSTTKFLKLSCIIFPFFRALTCTLETLSTLGHWHILAIYDNPGGNDEEHIIRLQKELQKDKSLLLVNIYKAFFLWFSSLKKLNAKMFS
jgi:hypothetical protein